MKAESPNHVDIAGGNQNHENNITGCVFMPSGEAVLCDCRNLTLIIQNISFCFKESLTLETQPFDVSVINNSTVIVTCPGTKKLQYIEIKPKLKARREVRLDKQCWGVAVANETIYVTCHTCVMVGLRDGEIRILDLDGNIRRKVGCNFDGSFKFCWPYYIAASTTSENLFVTDGWSGSVICLTPYGHTVYEYSEDDLGFVRGVCVDVNDNIMVCGRRSDNIKVITVNGNLHCTLLTIRNGIKYPQAIAYREGDSMLIVACAESKYLYTKYLEM